MIEGAEEAAALAREVGAAARAAGRRAAVAESLTGGALSAAVTGVGGPESQEGRPPGTVFIAVATEHGGDVFEHRFDGEPDEIVRSAIEATIEHLRDAVRR